MGHEGLIDKPAQLEDEVDCPVCTGLTDKDCLNALDAMVTNMKPIDRLMFEKSWAGSQCGGLSDDDCLAVLDQARQDASDKERLIMEKLACSDVGAVEDVPEPEQEGALPAPDGSDAGEDEVEGATEEEDATQVPPEEPEEDNTTAGTPIDSR